MSLGSVLLSKNILLTEHGGFATLLKNSTGKVIEFGTVCSCSPTMDCAIVPCENGMESIGVALEDIPDEALGWVVTSGIAEILLVDDTAAFTGGWVRVDEKEGRVLIGKAKTRKSRANSRLIGLCLENKKAGVNVLVKVVLHFL